MGWVHQDRAEPDHNCERPMQWVKRGPLGEKTTYVVPNGRLGDLWRCHGCRKLWRIGHVSDALDRTNDHDRRAVPDYVHTVWRTARLGQRIRYARRRGR